MYNPKSLQAEEFINHEEVLASLEYADANKDNLPLIRQILDKARCRKGLDHREASVLLACEDAASHSFVYDRFPGKGYRCQYPPHAAYGSSLP